MIFFKKKETLAHSFDYDYQKAIFRIKKSVQ